MPRFVSVVLAASVALCQVASLSALIAESPAIKSVTELVIDFYSYQNAGKCKEFAALLAPKFVVTDPFGSPPTSNATDVQSGCEQAASMFSTVNLYPIRIYLSGDGAAVAFQVASVAKGSGCVLDFTGIDTFAVDATLGKITAVTGYYDTSIPAKQMNCTGALPSAK